MLQNSEFIIECLKSDIEKRIGRTLQTPNDFHFLSLKISNQCDESISAHTLMRIWGYINSRSKPSVTSLSILSRFLGYMDFHHYSIDVQIRKNDNSAYIETNVLTADILDPGDVVVLSWKPDRMVSLSYKGNLLFEVISNENSKLPAGTEFRCVSFAVGLPFIAYITNREKTANCNYIGGKDSGLTSIVLKKSNNNQ